MKWENVHTADNPVQAGMVRGLLEAGGLTVQLRGMDLWAAGVEIYYAEGARPSVWVLTVQADEARRILTEAPDEQAGRGWTCRRCGTPLEGQFTACWHCGTAREA